MQLNSKCVSKIQFQSAIGSLCFYWLQTGRNEVFDLWPWGKPLSDKYTAEMIISCDSVKVCECIYIWSPLDEACILIKCITVGYVGKTNILSGSFHGARWPLLKPNNGEEMCDVDSLCVFLVKTWALTGSRRYGLVGRKRWSTWRPVEPYEPVKMKQT